ncbi:MAG: iron ABC transporter permease [Bacillota bacterium]
MTLLAGLLMALFAGSLAIGPVWIPPGRAVAALLPGRWTGAGAEFPDKTIITELRLPRALLATATGMALGMAGAALQGLFRNPLADPYVVGASGGAAFGATVAILSGWGFGVAGLASVPLAAFSGALGAVVLAYVLAEASGGLPTQALLLVGAALSTLLSALVAGLLLLQDRAHLEVFGWLVGGFSGRSWPALNTIVPVMFLGAVVLSAVHHAMDALALGEETARSLGLSLERLRGGVVVGSSLLTAGAVAAGGIIGFVGLMAPHMARYTFPAAHRWVLPASGLTGALIMLLADDVGRVAVAPAEVPAGILTAVLGAPFFLYLLKTRGGPGHVS